jgi:hypothetical protein
MSVLPGGWSERLLEAMIGAEEIAGTLVGDVAAALAEKSMVELSGGRYRMLEVDHQPHA